MIIEKMYGLLEQIVRGLPRTKILLPAFMWVSLTVLLAVGVSSRHGSKHGIFWNAPREAFEPRTLDNLADVVQAGALTACLCAAAQAWLLGLTTETHEAAQAKGPRRKALDAITVWNLTLAVVLGLDQLSMLYDWAPVEQEPLRLGVLLCMACGPFFHVYVLLRAVEARTPSSTESAELTSAKRAAIWAGVVWCIPKVIYRIGPGLGWQIAGTVALILARLYMCVSWRPKALAQIKGALSHWSTIWGPILADFLLLFVIDGLELCIIWGRGSTGIRESHSRLLMCIAWIIHAVHEPYMIAWASITGDEAKRVAAERVAMRTELAARDKQLQDQTEAEAARQKFMRYIFHEVRVPFNSIDMGLALLEEEEMGNMSHEGRATLSIMTKAALSMRVIINDTLDWSKIQSGAFQVLFGPARISDIIQSTVLNMTPFAASPELQVQLSCEVDDDMPAWVLADKVRLQQVLANFVSNAIKFSPHNWEGKVKVSAFVLTESKQLSEVETARLGKVWWKADAVPPTTGARAAIKDMMKRMNSASAVVTARLAQMASFRGTPAARRGNVTEKKPAGSASEGGLRNSLRSLAGFIRRGSTAPLPEAVAVTVRELGEAPLAAVPVQPEPWQPPHLPSLRTTEMTTAMLSQLNSEGFTVDGQGGCVLVLEVQDNGDGIAKADIPTLFQAFKQLDAGLQYKGKGTGLGLAICQEIVALHGGRVGVRSAGRPGEGAAFLVALRLATLTQNGHSTSFDSDGPQAGKEGGTGYYGSSTHIAKITRTYSNSSFFNKQQQAQRASPALQIAPHHHQPQQVPPSFTLSPTGGFPTDTGAGAQAFMVAGPMSPPARRPSRRLSRRLSRRQSAAEGSKAEGSGAGGVLSRLARRISDGFTGGAAANHAAHHLERHASRRSDSPSVRSLSSVRSVGSNKSWGSIKTVGSVRSQGSIRSAVQGVASPGGYAVRGSRVYSGLSVASQAPLPGTVPDLASPATSAAQGATGQGVDKKPRSILKKEGTQRRVSIVDPHSPSTMPYSPSAVHIASGTLSPTAYSQAYTPVGTEQLQLGGSSAPAGGSSSQQGAGARRNSVSNERVAAVQATMIRRANEAAALTVAAIHDPNAAYLPVAHGHHGTSMSTFMRLEPQLSSGTHSSGAGGNSSSGNTLGIVHSSELPPLSQSQAASDVPAGSQPHRDASAASTTGGASTSTGGQQPPKARRLSQRYSNSDYGDSVHSFRVNDDTASGSGSAAAGAYGSSGTSSTGAGQGYAPTLHTGGGIAAQAGTTTARRASGGGVFAPHGLPKLETVSELSPVAGSGTAGLSSLGGSKDVASPVELDAGLHLRSPAAGSLTKMGGTAPVQAAMAGAPRASPWAAAAASAADSDHTAAAAAPVSSTPGMVPPATSGAVAWTAAMGSEAQALPHRRVAALQGGDSVGDPQPVDRIITHNSSSGSSGGTGDLPLPQTSPAVECPPVVLRVVGSPRPVSPSHGAPVRTHERTVTSNSSPYMVSMVSPDGGASVGNHFHKLSPLSGRSHTESRTATGASASLVAPDLVLRVLVVDDAADNRKLLARSLRLKLGQALKAGKLGTFMALEIDECEDGDAAVHAVCGIPHDVAMSVGRAGGPLSEEQLVHVQQGCVRGGLGWYHGITMDAEMPRLSGFAATPLIRSAGYKGPIFGCTGNALPEDQKLFRDAGVNRVFCKPVQVPEVVDALLAAWKKQGLI